MLPETIKKRSEFLRVGKFGTRARTAALISVCCKNDEDISRVGYVVNKKVGKAARRNKVKRRLRNIVREFQSEFVNGYSFVFIATPNAFSRTFSDLKTDFLYCIRKSKRKIENEYVE